MESRHFESQSTPLLTPESPLPPHFEKSGYAPVLEKSYKLMQKK